MARYAEGTEVTIEKSRNEIERMITRYGAEHFAYAMSPGQALVMFEAHSRKVVFELPLPPESDFSHQRNHVMRSATSRRAAWDAECRRRWRALFLVIKAKLEAVESGITTFEEEFLAHIMMPDGMTVGKHVKPAIHAAYTSGKMIPLLPPPDKGSGK